MVIYTIVPPEELWEEDSPTPLEQPIKATLGGISVLVQPTGEGVGRVERVLSTDPNHFLDPRVTPGTSVRLM